MKAIRLFTLLAACLFAMAALAQQNPPAPESGDDHPGGRMDTSHAMGSVDDTSSSFRPSSTSPPTSKPRSRPSWKDNIKRCRP